MNMVTKGNHGPPADRHLNTPELQVEFSLSGLAAWLPRRLLLAIDLMLDIAFNGSAGPLPAAELGERQGLETRKLEAILQRLSRAGLLKSVRGPNGGYLLGQERGAITVKSIAAAVLGGDKPAAFEHSPSASMRKVVLPLVDRLHHVLVEEMSRVTLADLCDASRKVGLQSKCDGMTDFVI
ncbi:MAG TPA: Rrf2 family transcriptional regulator [Stellaceae bacterium]|jgi:Rrf2 family protein|nr:Rrf2 family transcriptional regulator [Stellaceae bacterium]